MNQDRALEKPQKMSKEFWKDLCEVIFEYGYLCYDNNEGSYFVLSKLIEVLNKHSKLSKKNKVFVNKSDYKNEILIADVNELITGNVWIETCKRLFNFANECGLEGIRLKNIEYAERPSGPLGINFYKLFKWEIDDENPLP